ncbi:MAG: hypothetical protein DVB28_000451 [Verrucomicrobia bacterium]|nr:MAG: hypothetical protein DVB28_000451 [Verrucomicrobiota bacterium]
MVQRALRGRNWTFLRHLILRTNSVRDGLVCELPRGFHPGEKVNKIWKERLKMTVADFTRLSDQQKAERILEAERLGQNGFLRLLILKTDCVRNGFIGKFPKLSWRTNRAVKVEWQRQVASFVDFFKQASSRERWMTLRRIVQLKQWRALIVLVESGRIGLLGLPGEMPAVISEKRAFYKQWEAQITEALEHFVDLTHAQKKAAVSDALIFQKTRFIRELLTVSSDGLGHFLEALPCSILSDENVNENWMRLRLPEVENSEDPALKVLYKMQRLRAEPVGYAVGRHWGIEGDAALFCAWREGWIAFLRSRRVPRRRIPKLLLNDPQVGLGAWREGFGLPGSATTLGVENRLTLKVPAAPGSTSVSVLAVSCFAGAPESVWSEGGVTDTLESREAWAWAWRMHLLWDSSDKAVPPLQLRNIPQILEAWATRRISNLVSEYSLDEHGMPFPADLNVTLLNGGLLHSWAHAWNQFARRDGTRRVINAVPRELRSHPLIEALCREGLISLPLDIGNALAHSNALQRERGCRSLVVELKRTPVPLALIPEGLIKKAEVLVAWGRGWREFFENQAMPSEAIPRLLASDEAVLRAWRKGWNTALKRADLVPWHCIPRCLREEANFRREVVEKWLAEAKERNWIRSAVPPGIPERDALFFQWLNAWYILPKKRQFLRSTGKEPRVPELQCEYWTKFLSNSPVYKLSSIPQKFRGLAEVKLAWMQGWVMALKENAVYPSKIPRKIFKMPEGYEAFQMGWIATMRTAPLSFWELPNCLWEDCGVVESLVAGWIRRIESFSEQELWVLPPRAWFNAVIESEAAQAENRSVHRSAGGKYKKMSFQGFSLPKLWMDAGSRIQASLRTKCVRLFALDSDRLNAALGRHIQSP